MTRPGRTVCRYFALYFVRLEDARGLRRVILREGDRRIGWFNNDKMREREREIGNANKIFEIMFLNQRHPLRIPFGNVRVILIKARDEKSCEFEFPHRDGERELCDFELKRRITPRTFQYCSFKSHNLRSN